jgi:hypothetical protein
MHRRTEPKIHELGSLGSLGFEFITFHLFFCVAIASEDGTENSRVDGGALLSFWRELRGVCVIWDLSLYNASEGWIPIHELMGRCFCCFGGI